MISAFFSLPLAHAFALTLRVCTVSARRLKKVRLGQVLSFYPMGCSWTPRSTFLLGMLLVGGMAGIVVPVVGQPSNSRTFQAPVEASQFRELESRLKPLRFGVVSGSTVSDATLDLLEKTVGDLTNRSVVRIDVRTAVGPAAIDTRKASGWILLGIDPADQKRWIDAVRDGPVVVTSWIDPVPVASSGQSATHRVGTDSLDQDSPLDGVRVVQVVPDYGAGVRRLASLVRAAWPLGQEARPVQIVVLIDSVAIEADPQLGRRLEAYHGVEDVDVDVLSVGSAAAPVVEALAGRDVDGVYVAPLLQMSGSERSVLAREIQEARRPSLVAEGRAELTYGFLAALDEDIMARVARQSALAFVEQIDRIPGWSAEGRSQPLRQINELDPTLGASDTTVLRDPVLLVSDRVSESLRLELPWSLRLEVERISAGSDAGPPLPDVLTLDAAVQAGAAENLSLLLDQLQAEVAGRGVGIARSALLPQVTTELAGRIIDPDLATAGLGSNPERLLTASASFRQVLFSEPALARLSVERIEQLARNYELETARLLFAEASGAAFLNVLRTRATQRVQEATLAQARANLDVAIDRRRVGEGDPAEIARLEVVLFRSRERLVAASGRARTAEVSLNQILNRPLETPVQVATLEATGPHLPGTALPSALDSFVYASYLDRPQTQSAFAAFWVREARDHAPEIRAMRELVRAEERQLTSNQRRFFVPELALSGSVTRRLLEEGVGSRAPVFGDRFNIPLPPTDAWSIGLSLAFPLFEGSSRIYRVQQSERAVSAARTRLDLIEQRVEQQIRDAVIGLETAYIAALQTARAETSAKTALDIIGARYAEGTEDVLALIDAQESARIAREESVSATYDVYAQWLALQRATGVFGALQTPTERTQIKVRLMQAVRL